MFVTISPAHSPFAAYFLIYSIISDFIAIMPSFSAINSIACVNALFPFWFLSMNWAPYFIIFYMSSDIIIFLKSNWISSSLWFSWSLLGFDLPGENCSAITLINLCLMVLSKYLLVQSSYSFDKSFVFITHLRISSVARLNISILCFTCSLAPPYQPLT